MTALRNFEQQPDGSYLPTAALMDRVRANPEAFPDAATDFARMSGKSVAEVQSILENHGSYFGAVGDRVTDLVQGGSEAVAIAAENLLPDSVLGEGAASIREFSEGLDPKFETEKGIVENLTEGVGQAVPAIAATIGTGGWAGLAIGAGVSTLTFDNEETLAATMEEIAPGITPDILVPQEGDSEEVKTLKALAANTVTDALAMGAFNVAGKALKGLKGSLSGPAKAPAVDLVAPQGAPSVTAATPRNAVEQVKSAAVEATARKLDNSITAEEAIARTKTGERRRLAARINGQGLTAKPVDTQLRDRFILDATVSADRLTGRAADVAAGAVSSEALPADMTVFLHRMYDALEAGDDAALLATAKQGVTTAGTVNNSYAQTVTAAAIRQALYRKGIGFEEMVALVRSDPSIATKPAAAQTLREISEGIMSLAEIDRHLGSAASYQLNYRKGIMQGTGKTVDDAVKYLEETFGEDGISLFADRFEFIDGAAKQLDGSGIDLVKLLPQLDDMFTEFDKARQGALANLKDNMTSSMSAEEKAKAVGSTIRMIKDLQTTALLSQFSTTGLDIVSNTFNNLLLPFMEHGITKGNWGRAGREYAGYLSGFGKAREIAVKAWKQGEGVLDDFDILDQTTSRLSYSNFPIAEKPAAHLALRMAKVATDAALASSEFWKATRAQGLAYADGLELALSSGMGRGEAKRLAADYVSKQFNEAGQLINAKYRLDAAETAWQSTFDTRYVTGKVGQAIDNVRNRDDVTGLLARSAMPFFRTLVNIGSNSMQYLVPPGTPFALRQMAKSQRFAWLQKVPKTLKALDDFTGANGTAAQNRAVGRHRLGMAATLAAYSLVQVSEDVEITGASGFKRWDARKRAFEEYPPNSIVIDGTSYDLNRMLPFSAPLMLVGMLRDMEMEAQTQMEGGNYSADNGSAQALVDYVPALALTNLTLFQDGSAMQGVFNLFDAVQQAVEDKNLDALGLYAEKYAQQFTPGPVKMIAKNVNETQYEGFDFFSRYAAAAGFPVGLPKLDFAGDPIVHQFGRGVDPFNRKPLKLDSPLHREFVELNRLEGLAMVPPRPDMVFDKRYWRKMGVETDNILSDGNMPPLTQLDTISGKNGWEAYREYLYRGALSEDTTVNTSGQGDGVDVGKVLIRKGETFKAAMSRIIEAETYNVLTPDARAKVWNAVFSHFKGLAKDQLERELIVKPEVFAGSRYGSPLGTPAILSDVKKSSAAMASQAQRTKGSPLDEAFSINR